MAPRGEGFGLVDRRGAFVQYAPRQDTPSDSSTNPPAEPTTPTETPPVDTPTSDTPTPTPTSDGTPTSTPTNNNSESKPNDNNHSQSQSQSNNNTPTKSPNNNPSTPTWTLTTSTSTKADGGVVVITQTIQATIPPSNSTPPPATASEAKSSGISTGTITGIAIAGTIAGVAVVGFIVWKWMAGRKRLAEFDSDEIKWPELKEESHALPARPTGRHGAGLDGEDDRTDAMSSAYGPSTINTGPYGHAHQESVSQLLPAGAAVSYAASQPGYAPTQLSHGYSDSVTSGGVYHDPYAAPPHPGMSMSPAPSHPGMSMSPAPLHPGMSMSPAPGMIPARQQSPGPSVAYGGYDAAGRMSPGPAMAYGGPPPGGPPPAQYPAQYGGGYDTGRRSPGPNGAYGMS